MLDKEDGIGIMGRNQGKKRKGHVFQGGIQDIAPVAKPQPYYLR
jgi:hypothetical protein